MEENLKQLLLKDLCARLPYGVKVKCASEILTFNINWLKVFQYHLGEIKPYLRPMSSMTEEERREFSTMCFESNELGDIATLDASDWLNEHHFDYRGLIEKGLALEAPEDMYNI